MLEAMILSALLAGSPPAIYQAQADPDGLQGEWLVEIIDDVKVMPNTRVTMAFQGARVSGQASCNSYSGTFTIRDRTLEIRGILSTMKACDEARMSQERDFFELLRNAARYEVMPNGMLVVTTIDGKRITARRARAS